MVIKFSTSKHKGNNMKSSADLLNHIIEVGSYNSYLEIGVDKGVTLRAVKAEIKQGVDPNVENMEDVFTGNINQFITEINEDTFDLIFIDGDHTHESSTNDLNKSLTLLNKGGTIVMHDTNPADHVQGAPTRHGNHGWCGTVWKTAVEARMRDDLIVKTLDLDTGYTIITVGKNEEPLAGMELKYVQYEKFADHRAKWLGLVSLSDYLGIEEVPFKSVPADKNAIIGMDMGSPEGDKTATIEVPVKKKKRKGKQ